MPDNTLNVLEKSVFFCEECDKINNRCYELEGVYICCTCFSENLRVLNEKEIPSFIRSKRLKRLDEISKNI